MVTLMLLAGTALADPVALRIGASTGVTAAVGFPESSVAWRWASDQREGRSMGVSAEWRLPLGAAGASVGWQQRIDRRPDRGWDLGVAGGVLVPLRDPGLAVSLTPSARRFRVWSQTELGAGLALPVVVRLTGLEARVPIQPELSLSRQLGAIRLGLHAGLSIPLDLTGGWALGGQAAVVVSGAR